MVNYYFQCSTVKFRVSFMVVNLTFTDTDWHPRYGIVNRYNAFSFPRRRARDFPYYQRANRKRCLRMWRDFENERLTILFVPILKLEMFCSLWQSSNDCEMFSFRLENVFEMTIDRVHFVYFIPNEHMNKLWIFQAFTSIHKIYNIYKYIFLWKFNLLKILSSFSLNL